ncbi:chloramphenicol efflux MFS transporter [Bdellovibrio bacteriovorus]|uniref:Chloramphenicol efflux MFS transporter n=1 Tax=Bdellovibrio bacteriovorus TaxID=959 RepID=A0A150WQ77_BDEBC|nr:CmlA/FloR family chloramphenicol efflux MFS transporter [Bdellovibrio bacteriovorus]KYG66580.1 chloramphenicol efflux MFS transporter [Bdellovibrio bacteriovorus]
MPIHNQNRGWSYSLTASLILMAPFDLLASLAMDIYLPVISEMPKILQTSPQAIQLTLSLYLIVLGLGQLAFGPMSDQVGRRPVLLFGAFLFAGSSLLISVLSSANLFIALRVLQGLGASAMLVATFATVRDVYGGRPESALIYSLFSSMLAFVPALGPIAGALIANQFSWRGIFIFLGVASFAASLHAFLRWPETLLTPSVQKRVSFKEILSHQHFWTYTVGFSAAMGSFFVFFSTAPRILIERQGLSQTEFSFAFASVALVMVISARGAKNFINRWKIQGCFKRGLGVLILGAIILALIEMTVGQNLWTVLASMSLIAFGIVLTVSVTANGALERFAHVAGSATALYYSIQSLIVGTVGTFFIMILPGDTIWPLAAFSALMASVSLGLLKGTR